MDQYNSVNGSSRAYDIGVTWWPEAVQYFLRSYATNIAFQQAVLTLQYTRQCAGEPETEYSVPLIKAFHRCGSLYRARENCTMFMDGLDPVVRSLDTRFWKDKRRITYLELFQPTKVQDDAFRARPLSSSLRMNTLKRY